MYFTLSKINTQKFCMSKIIIKFSFNENSENKTFSTNTHIK